MKQFAVIGNPIAHSKSPEIHSAFAAQFGITLQYERLLANIGQFDLFAHNFFEYGVGANVTVPFKEDALKFADELSDEARLAGAVNTLLRQNNLIKGDNTDGIGLVRDIRDNHNVSLTNQKILLLGAGGAAKGVVLPIAREKPHSITIANRTPQKAEQLARQFTDYTNTIATSFEALTTPFDIIINATSASLSGQKLPLNPALFTNQTFAYDMMYGAKPTAFMQLAQSQGSKAVDGLGMLVEQAAKSFEIWHQVKPDTRPIIQGLQAQRQK